MSKRPILIGLGIIAVAGVITAIVLRNQPQQGAVKLGILVPQTGGAASYGHNARKGAELAVKDFTAKHPDIHVERIVEDSRGEAAAANKAAQKLLDLDRVDGIVGCVTS